MDPAFTSNLRRTSQHAFLLINHHTSLPNPQTNFHLCFKKLNILLSTTTALCLTLKPIFHPYFNKLSLVLSTTSRFPPSPSRFSKRLTAHSLTPIQHSHNNHARVQPPNHHPLRPPGRLRSTRHGLRHVPHIHVATRL